MLNSVAGKIKIGNREYAFITDDLVLIETAPTIAALGATKTSLSMSLFCMIV